MSEMSKHNKIKKKA